jgi:Methyl-accepting chemotaxis protein (MCP) signalling domain
MSRFQSISVRVMALALAGITGVGALAIVSYVSSERVHRRIVELNESRASLLDQGETDGANYAALVGLLQAASAENAQDGAAVKARVDAGNHSADLRSATNALADGAAVYQKSVNQTANIIATGDSSTKSIVDVIASHEIFDAVYDAANEQIDSESEAAARQSQQSLRSLQRTVIVMTLVVAAVLSAAGWLARRRVVSSTRTMQNLVADLSTQAADLEVVSTSLASAAQQTSAQSVQVAASAKATSQGIELMSAAAEEMGATVNEIAASTSSAASVSSTAATRAQDVVDQMQRLTGAASEISHVAELVRSIAEQTNLLALNATIEAARAGDAGRGFAVVADEVKQLAQHTSQATLLIGDKVRDVQLHTDEATAAVAQIAQIITEMSALQSTIATATEEQAVTTRHISEQAHSASSSSHEITATMGEVATAAETSNDIAHATREAARHQSEIAESLRVLVAAL